MNWPVFFTRLGSAILFSAVMMAGLLAPTPWAIFALAALIQFLCLREFISLMEKIFPGQHFPSWIPFLLQLGGVWIMLTIAVPDGNLFYISFLLPVLVLLISVLSKRTAFTAGLCVVLGWCYISLPMGFLIGLRGIHLVLPLALILMIWMNDTMAYIVGSFIGKTPFSAISPKKTWEGTIGGVLLTLAGAAVWAYYSPFSMYTLIDWMMLAAITCIAGTAGDLLESKLKRMAAVKDSGNLMPGHGGALDRFDSLLVTLPFAFCYILWFMV